ncbi:putative metal-binding motif-containing protein [Myxococcota bacterium]|nr:putative metal-binding motif-containing protein [Myxococcota bacterium]
MPCTLLMLALWACGSVTDEDLDGSPAGEDCDDLDPFVYPGAPDDPGDGVDADCDGVDPPWPFLGSWVLTSLSASYAGIPLFEEGTAEGLLVLDPAFDASLEVGVTVSEVIAGQPIPIAMAFAGWASPLPGDGWVSVWAEGEQYDEQMHIDWLCQVVAGEADAAGLACAGELKALEGSLDATATFAAQ